MDYSELKMNAIAELEETTMRSKETISDSVTQVKQQAIAELTNDYESILSGWDTQKANFDHEIKIATDSIKSATTKSCDVIDNITQIDKDIEATKTNLKKLDINTASLAAKVMNVATDATTTVV